MATLTSLIDLCDELLDPASFEDYCPNGLQVPGRTEVRKVASCVSAHLESITRAVDQDADLLIAHHGVFWDSQPRALSGPAAERLRVALGAGLSIAGYHLPLDAHPGVGNNALLRDGLGFAPSNEPFAVVRGKAIGVVGRSSNGVPVDELTTQVREFVGGRPPLVFACGPDRVRSIGIISGAGSDKIGEAAALGLDALLTGEPSEPAMADAREHGITYIAAGHYATETFGIRALGDYVAERLDVEHVFVDVPNPV